jgi:hypothetical protein
MLHAGQRFSFIIIFYLAPNVVTSAAKIQLELFLDIP